MTHNSFVVSNCCEIGGLFGLCQKSAESENKQILFLQNWLTVIKRNEA